MKQSTRHPQAHGFTALELIIVLVIGFSIIAMSASKMGELFNSSKITRATSSIMELATSIRSLQGADGYGTAGSLTQNLIDNDLVPKTLKKTNNTIENEWNGTVEAAVINNGKGFSIEYPAIPKSACSKLATGLLSSGIFSSLDLGAAQPLINGSTAQIILASCAAGAAATGLVTFKLEVDGTVPQAAQPQP